MGMRAALGQRRRDNAPRGSLLLLLERRLGITVAGLSVLGAVLVGWLLGRSSGSSPLLLLSYGLLMLVVLAWALGRRRIVIDVGRSKVPTRVREGQLVDVELELASARRLSTIVLEESLPEHLGGPRRFPLPMLSPGEQVQLGYAFAPARRGRYTVGPLVAEWSDPFGLTQRRVVLDTAVELIVHPSTEQVHDRVISRAWEDPPIRPPLSKPWPTGFEFYGMRDYVSGDDPRRINWRATARSLDVESGTGRYLVREAEQGITDRVNLFLNTDERAHSPGETSETFELAVRGAASLAVKHLRDGFALDVHTNGGVMATGARGRRAELPLLDQLAEVEREREPFSAALDRLLTSRGGSTHNVILTPQIDRDAAMRLRLILNRGVSVLLALVMWEDTDPVTLQRAGSLGCGVVEIAAGAPLEKVFRQAIGGRR